MTSQQIRQQFLDFFASKGHAYVPSSPVVPHDDPTLMFTNAGMNQFKPIFLGTARADHPRVANSQKCIRAGGKHNDLDDVGQDTYHHTFFEMLGNWSFGDYFKKEAIEWAWELLTKVWGIDKSRLHATYFGGLSKSEPRSSDRAVAQNSMTPLDSATPRGLKSAARDGHNRQSEWELEPDNEARELWASVTDIDPSHIHPGNMKDNFWEMGDTGPCGPCSEIHIDLTPDKSGGPLVNKGDARVMEIWNLVFIQFNRGTDGKLTPLPAKHVDTGMGFERLCAVLQKKTSNYDTDVFTPIFDAIRKRTNAPKYTGLLPNPVAPVSNRCDTGHWLETGATSQQLLVDVSYRVIADHLRCLVFALTDGAIPSNEGRGYVLRRILRRAVRYGRQYLNMHEPFLCDLVPTVVEHMGNIFPELRAAHRGKNIENVVSLIRDEEVSFLKTLDRGIKFWNRAAIRAAYRALRPGVCVVGPLPEAGQVGSRGAVKNEDVFSGDPNQLFDLDGHHFSVNSLGSNDVRSRLLNAPVISGEDAFRLHDTYGFPIDLTELMAEEQGLTIDLGDYERLMELARDKARGGAGHATQSEVGADTADMIQKWTHPTYFSGYEKSTEDWAVVEVVCADPRRGEFRAMKAGETGMIVLGSSTPFYAEKGGQVGDRGRIELVDGSAVFEVSDTRDLDGRHLHFGHVMKGTVDSRHPDRPVSQQRWIATVATEWRSRVEKNHTSTHILNWALREVLCPSGERENPHVQQKGSLVDPEKTRFDFSHNHALTGDEIARIERLVKEQIGRGHEVIDKLDGVREVDQKAAREINTLRAVFGEKYPDKVRVVSVGADIKEMLRDPRNPRWMQYSVEFCGGTHVANSRDIGDFVLVHEEAVAKGVRRVVGLTADKAREAIRRGEEFLEIAEALRAGRTPPAPPLTKGGSGQSRERERADTGETSGPYDLARLLRDLSEATIPILTRHQLAGQIAELQETAKEQQKKSSAQAQRGAVEAVAEMLAAKSVEVGGVTVLVAEVPHGNADALRSGIDYVRNKKGSSAVLLATAEDGKVTLVAGMSKDVVERGVKAGDLIKEICPRVGGKGGGRPDMAQGGGTDPKGLPKALDRAREWLGERLA